MAEHPFFLVRAVVRAAAEEDLPRDDYFSIAHTLSVDITKMNRTTEILFIVLLLLTVFGSLKGSALPAAAAQEQSYEYAARAPNNPHHLLQRKLPVLSILSQYFNLKINKNLTQALKTRPPWLSLPGTTLRKSPTITKLPPWITKPAAPSKTTTKKKIIFTNIPGFANSKPGYVPPACLPADPFTNPKLLEC